MRRACHFALALLFPVALLVAASTPVVAQDSSSSVDPGPGHSFGFEIKASYRDSDAERFPVSNPLLPPGVDAALETVEPGEHFEVSVATVFYRGTWGEKDRWGAKAKVDLIDRFDRNPTSSDREWDVDELWLRWGPEFEPGEFREGFSIYGKLGKIPRFERQDDRHLESYGLLSTAFNRMEDVGLEIGVDLGRIFYLKTSFTQGNPVFFRDPNALAGDNGTPELEQAPFRTELGSGIPILYDADVDEVNFDEPEVSLGLGLRFGNESTWSLDVLAFGNRRDLADTVDLHGTFYGGDLDLLFGPGNLLPLIPITSRTKEEFGVNLWLYAGGLSIFGQYVDQDLAGLERDGYEIEIAYDFEMPYLGSLFGRQVLSSIAPAVRYSEIDPQFGATPGFPAPSVFWDWEKLDLGLRLGLVQGMVDMTVEYSDNEFIRAGRAESADELLATFHFMWDWSPDPVAF